MSVLPRWFRAAALAGAHVVDARRVLTAGVAGGVFDGGSVAGGVVDFVGGVVVRAIH